MEVVGERSAHVWWLQPEIDTTTASAGIATKFKGKSPLFSFDLDFSF